MQLPHFCVLCVLCRLIGLGSHFVLPTVFGLPPFLLPTGFGRPPFWLWHYATVHITYELQFTTSCLNKLYVLHLGVFDRLLTHTVWNNAPSIFFDMLCKYCAFRHIFCADYFPLIAGLALLVYFSSQKTVLQLRACFTHIQSQSGRSLCLILFIIVYNNHICKK